MLPLYRWSSFVTVRRPCGPLGVRWSLVDVCGPVVRYMRQVKSGVSHTSNRFSKSVSIACGHFLRAVSPVYTALSVTDERAAHILTDASHP